MYNAIATMFSSAWSPRVNKINFYFDICFLFGLKR